MSGCPIAEQGRPGGLAEGETLADLAGAIHDDAVSLAENRGGDAYEIERAMLATFADVVDGRASSRSVDLLGERFRLERVEVSMLDRETASAVRAAGRKACDDDGVMSAHEAIDDLAGYRPDAWSRIAEGLRGYADALYAEADRIDARVRRGHELGTVCATCGDPEGVRCCEDAPVPLGPAAVAA